MPAPGKGIGKKIAGLFGAEQEKKSQPGKTAADNRLRGDVIASELRSIDFEHGAYTGKTPGDSPEKLREKVAALIRILENAPTICENIAGLDELLLYAARAMKEGVKEGRYNKVIWAKNALCAGVLYLRDSIPADYDEQIKETMQARIDYMKKYKTIIQLYEKADVKQQAIQDYQEQILAKHGSYDPKIKKIKELMDTAEGQRLYGRLKMHENEPNVLNEEENEWLSLIRMAASEAHTLYLLGAAKTAAQQEYEMASEQADDIRIMLTNKPIVFNPELTALHALAVEEQIKDIARSLAEAATAIETRVKSDAKLKAVMDGRDAQTVVHHSVKFMDDILNGQEEDDLAAIQEGKRMADRVNRMENARKQAEELARQAMNEVKSFSTNADLYELFSEEENVSEQTSENDNENLNYNT